MGKFSEDQKKIAVLLMSSPKTVEELNKQLNIPYDELNRGLKEMLKLKLLKVEGYPQKYKLMDNIVEAVHRRKELAEKDPFNLRLKAIIEFKAVELDFLNKHMDELADKLKNEKDFTLYDTYKAEPVRDEGHYSSYLEISLSAKDFTSIVKFMYFYGPTSVEVIKPRKIVLHMDDLQDALMEMAEMIQSYNESMLKTMSKEELDKFAQELYKPKTS